MSIVTGTTLQLASVIDRLERSGIYEPRFDLGLQDYRHAYDWLALQYEQRRGLLPGGFVWFYVNWPQDIEDSYGQDRSQWPGDIVHLTLAIPEEHVLLMDYDHWYSPLYNAPYVPGNHSRFTSPEHEAAYDREYDRLKADPVLMHASWERIFDLDAARSDGSSSPHQVIQGVVPYLRAEWVSEHHIERRSPIAQRSRR